MSEAAAGLGTSARGSFSIFTPSRLQLYGYALAFIYSAALIHFYLARAWIVDHSGAPLYGDFTDAWVAGWHALNAEAAQLYDSDEFVRIQKALLGSRDFFYPNWPYPPTFFLILAPLSTLPYRCAFLTWDLATLLGCLAVVYLIARRPPAIALVLASPFTAWNFLAGQNGFLTASLLGASLFFLEKRPIAAGIIIGCLTYKPQFGILLPVALVASRQWYAIASAAVAAVLLAAASIVLFGSDAWAAFPNGFVEQSKLNLGAGPDSNWGYLQTVYGLIRSLHASANAAWLVQGLTTLTTAVIVWIVWQSRVRYPLKGATLSAAALIATPYAYAYDMAAIVVPAAFLATDQLRHGLLRGDKAIWLILFGAPLAVLVTLGDDAGGLTFGGTPISLLAVIVLFGVILRRVRQPAGQLSAL
jgi:arabinofuranan 3-O-arabinosyltransferase